MIDRLILPDPGGRSGAYRGHDPLGLGSRAEHDDARRVPRRVISAQKAMAE